MVLSYSISNNIRVLRSGDIEKPIPVSLNVQFFLGSFVSRLHNIDNETRLLVKYVFECFINKHLFILKMSIKSSMGDPDGLKT